MDVETASMTTRLKRTYNLSEDTVRRVRELAADYRVAESQDGVVELAIDRLYRERREADEAAQWATAAADPEFSREVATIHQGIDDETSWPR
jgi:hypothetical protein